MQCIVGDIGGTNSRLALVEVGEHGVKFCIEKSYKSKDFPSFEAVINKFKEDNHFEASIAAFGIPGPVDKGVVRVTNLPWIVDASLVERHANTDNVYLLNDLEAAAWGISWLGESDLVTLQEGAQTELGNAAIISPGTGLGEAGLFWNGKEHIPFATEGGHTDFSPDSQIEVALLTYLKKQLAHVSWERIVSGPGTVTLYKFLREKMKSKEEDLTLNRDIDPAQAITEKALAGSSELCVETMRLFTRCLGSEAGNLALKIMAKSGVYLGGGIPPKVLPFLQTAEFREAFCSKGRMRTVLEKMPLKVITNDKVALLGAARFSMRACSGKES